MLSILEHAQPDRGFDRGNDRVVSIDEGRPAAEPDSNPASDAEEAGEFEIVLGRRQMASVLFLGIVILVAFSAASYLAGKSLAPPKIVREPVPAAPAVAPLAAPETKKAEAAAPEIPLFGDPQNGATYLQLGAVEKGVAVLMTEGLRKRGFPSFAAPGPNDRIFRVLIGPLDTETYKSARKELDRLGVAAFPRKSQ